MSKRENIVETIKCGVAIILAGALLSLLTGCGTEKTTESSSNMPSIRYTSDEPVYGNFKMDDICETIEYETIETEDVIVENVVTWDAVDETLETKDMDDSIWYIGETVGKNDILTTYYEYDYTDGVLWINFQVCNNANEDCYISPLDFNCYADGTLCDFYYPAWADPETADECSRCPSHDNKICCIAYFIPNGTNQVTLNPQPGNPYYQNITIIFE